MRPTKAEMIEFAKVNFGTWNQDHNVRAEQALTAPKSVLSFYKAILQAITNCSRRDMVPYDAGRGIQGYEVTTSCPDQTQNFVRVDCTGVNVDGGGSKYLWSAAHMCKLLWSHVTSV